SIGKDQADQQGEAKAGRRFLDIIASQLRGGYCNLLSRERDAEPVHYEACGWRQEYRYDKDPFSQGGVQELKWVVPPSSKCIGYIDDSRTTIYLSPSATKDLANSHARRSGNSMAVSFNRIGQALLAEGLCVPAEEGGKTRADGRHRIRGTQDRFF